MNKNVYDILMERGFIEQSTNEEEVRKMFEKPTVFYTGIDATADSLTAGHFLVIMAIMHLQRAGHIPILLMGGGTTLIGDPTGRTEMRSMMTRDKIQSNVECFKKQISKYIKIGEGIGYFDNNINWIEKLNYIDFMRDVAVHFNVKHMLQAECYSRRVDQGLTMFEFNYMLMQSYDFYMLNKKYGCTLQVGGNDQWSNMIGGLDLVRLKEKKSVQALALKLLVNSDGVKMGKSSGGAIWIDPSKTSPFEFFQYWRSIEDAKVGECLALFTFLPMEEVNRLSSFEGSEINKAKEILAYEITKIVHGQEEADKALESARALFSGKSADNAPTYEITKAQIESGIEIFNLLVELKMEQSKAEAKRSIKQGGVTINGVKVDDIFRKIEISDFENDENLILKKGKKKIYQIKLIKE